MRPLSHQAQLTNLTLDLILISLTKRELSDFDIFPYNSFTRARYYCLDTGNGEQVVFALDTTTGEVYVEEDTDRIGIKTSFASVNEFVNEYRKIVGKTVVHESYDSIYDKMNEIDDKESLNEKYNVRTLKDVKKLQESLNEANTGDSYKGYIICYGCHDTDRWYVKDGWNQFIGNKSGYTSEEEAREYVDSITD